MTTRITIRNYEPEDLYAVHRLAEKYASWDTTPTRVDIQGFYAISPQLFFLAETAGKVVGFVYGSESRHLPHETLMKWKADKVASPELLAVDENHRKQGIGTAPCREVSPSLQGHRSGPCHIVCSSRGKRRKNPL